MEHFFIILYNSYCWLLLVGRYRSRKTLKPNMRVVVHASGLLLILLCTFVLAIVFPGGELPGSPAWGWWNTCWKSRKTFPKPEGPHLKENMKYFSFFGRKIFFDCLLQCFRNQFFSTCGRMGQLPYQQVAFKKCSPDWVRYYLVCMVKEIIWSLVLHLPSCLLWWRKTVHFLLLLCKIVLFE